MFGGAADSSMSNLQLLFYQENRGCHEEIRQIISIIRTEYKD